MPLKARTLGLAFLIIVAVVAAWVGYGWLQRQFVSPGPAALPLRVEVPPGASVRGILNRIEERGGIDSARLVQLYLRLHGQRFKVQAGTYEIPAHASAAQVVALLVEGRVVLESLTVVEGSTFADFRRALAESAVVAASLKGKSNADIMAAIGRAGEDAEGRFFPDTYRFAAHTSDVEILKLAYASMQRVLDELWSGRAADLAVHSAYEALILASLVEKETGLASERARIAGVFSARLRRGMRLQSDPTVIYGMGESYQGDIRTRDLSTDTPYNTYTRAGLPPTPISLPGRESLWAAMHPAETGDLYFVATGEGDGAHHFSKTLEEHNGAVQRYLKHLREHERP